MEHESSGTNRSLVIPGEVIGEGDLKAGKNAYWHKGKIFATQMGFKTITAKFVNVIPLGGRYIPKPDDLIIGIIQSVSPTTWLVDINSPYPAPLHVNEVPWRVDFGDTARYLNAGDTILCRVFIVDEVKRIQVTMNDQGSRKLSGGQIIEISPSKVPRIIGKGGSMISLIKQKTMCRLFVGQNGRIWIDGDAENIMTAVNAIRYIDRESHKYGLTESIQRYLDETMGPTMHDPGERPVDHGNWYDEEQDHRTGEEQRGKPADRHTNGHGDRDGKWGDRTPERRARDERRERPGERPPYRDDNRGGERQHGNQDNRDPGPPPHEKDARDTDNPGSDHRPVAVNQEPHPERPSLPGSDAPEKMDILTHVDPHPRFSPERPFRAPGLYTEGMNHGSESTAPSTEVVTRSGIPPGFTPGMQGIHTGDPSAFPRNTPPRHHAGMAAMGVPPAEGGPSNEGKTAESQILRDEDFERVAIKDRGGPEKRETW